VRVRHLQADQLRADRQRLSDLANCYCGDLAHGHAYPWLDLRRERLARDLIDLRTHLS